MPSNFNGIEATEANFNGTALDFIFMNGVEVFSSSTGTIPVYSGFGQSNWSGKGSLSNCPANEKGIIPMSKVWNGLTLSWDDFESGVNNGNDTGNYSAMSKFAWLKYRDEPNTVHYYFITAVSQTAMYNRWNVTTPEHAAILVDYANMLASGDFFTHSIYWWQGESDANDVTNANAYQASESLMIDSYKTSFGSSRFVSFKLGYDLIANPQLPEKAIVNAAKDTNQAGGKSTVLIDSEQYAGLLDFGGIHYFSAGYEEIGQTAYDVYFDNGLNKDFVITVRTTAPNEIVTLPIEGDDFSSGDIDFGDGTIVDNLESNRTHQYTVAGDYEVRWNGMMTEFNFDTVSTSRDNIISIDTIGRNQLNKFVSTRGLRFCSNLVSINSNNGIVQLDFNGSQFMRGCGEFTGFVNPNDVEIEFNSADSLFRDCVKLNQFPAGFKCVGSNSRSVLWGCSVFNATMNGFITPSVTDVSTFFFNAPRYNQPFIGWETQNVSFWGGFLLNALDFDQPLDSLDFTGATTMINFMSGKTNSNYSTTNADILLNHLDSQLVFAQFTDVNINLGSIDYTSAGAVALANLISKGFVIAIGNEV